MSSVVASSLAPECQQTGIHENKAFRAHVPLVRFAKCAFAACVLTGLAFECSNMEGRKAGEKPVIAREPRLEKPSAGESAPAAPGTIAEAPKTRKAIIRSEPRVAKVALPAQSSAGGEMVRKPLIRSEPKPLKPAAAVGADGEVVRKPIIRSEPKLTVAGVPVTSGIAEVTDADAVYTSVPAPTASIDAKQRRSYFAPIFVAVMLLGAFAFKARELIGQMLNMPLVKDYFGIKKT